CRSAGKAVPRGALGRHDGGKRIACAHHAHRGSVLCGAVGRHAQPHEGSAGAARQAAARRGAAAAREAFGARDRTHPACARRGRIARRENITEEGGMKKLLVALVAAVFAVGINAGAYAQNVKIGIVAFISGPAAAPFGVPAKNSADFVIDELNAGRAPAPYNKKGFGGATIETVVVDEAGSTTTQVTEFRNLVQRHNVDLVIGYISSGNCLAIAPVAEELKKFTNFFDCGTPRIFEDAAYKYVFRTSST